MLGLGLSVSAAAVLAASGYHPMRDPLLAERWVANRPDLLTLGSGLVSEARGAKTGLALVQSTASFRPAWDAKAFGGVKNKTGAHNTNVFDFTGINSISAPAIRGVVQDPTAIAELATRDARVAELLAAGEITGWVLQIDNSAGASQAAINLAGVAGAAVTHTVVSMARKVSGPGGVLVCLGGVSCASAVTTTTYQRRTNTAVANVNSQCQLIVDPGTVGRFFLFGLYEGGPPPKDIVTYGAPRWDFGKPTFILDGGDDYLRSTGVGPLPTGADACHVILVQENMAPASDLTVRRAIQWGGSTTATARLVGRVSNGGLQNRAAAYTGDGSASVSATTVTSLNDGRRVIDAIFRADALQVGIDGGALASGFIATATGGNNVTLGAASQGTAVGFHQGHIASLDVFRGEPTTEQRAARIAWALKEAA